MPDQPTPAPSRAAKFTVHRDAAGFADAIDENGSVLLQLNPGTSTNEDGADAFVNYLNTLETRLAAAEEWEGKAIQLGSAYASGLIKLGTAKKLLEEAKKKAYDRFGGCVYCGLHKDKPHDSSCILIRAEKDLAEPATPAPSKEGK